MPWAFSWAWTVTALCFLFYFSLFAYWFSTHDLDQRFTYLPLFRFSLKFFVIVFRSFFKNNLFQGLVGTLSFLPLIYPNEPWRFQHDRHQVKTNMVVWHFNLKKLRPNQVNRVYTLSGGLYEAGIIGLVPCTCFSVFVEPYASDWLVTTSMKLEIIFGLMQMSTFTMAPHIPFKSSEEWNAAQAQLSGTVHCDFLFFNINVSTHLLFLTFFEPMFMYHD